MARDVGRIAAHYGAEWGRTELLLIGYSRGADLAPFVAQRLPPEERQRLRLVALLGPSTYAEFEVHAVDIFASLRRRGALPTEPAVRATAGAYRMVCVHGSDEHDSLCPRLAGLPWVKDVSLEGGHHFDGDYAALARIVLDAADRR
jgi:type IV secretory pathway VirJ component